MVGFKAAIWPAGSTSWPVRNVFFAFCLLAVQYILGQALIKKIDSYRHEKSFSRLLALVSLPVLLMLMAISGSSPTTHDPDFITEITIILVILVCMPFLLSRRKLTIGV
jgi:hypothetical protein